MQILIDFNYLVLVLIKTLLKMAESDSESFEDIELTEMEDRPEYQEPVLE